MAGCLMDVCVHVGCSLVGLVTTSYRLMVVESRGHGDDLVEIVVTGLRYWVKILG
ncbi:predicted protein [Sclerotinia sclerotiorum 1980 UF-70]|uniref:Uncharacterized protein n=1 Tax=Sclerotinia sclerotiorum (strain ATCC 18683 / 1980 / Ss-1) TaxID=665079 RepID=A7EV03_SCLS1|nr:predicted protein [Sclerotinia sclerotiorum 1980 UF-70]EDN93295.1 predicted protein [Sclerotinia sclerotiorum 1980 UF-70]